MSQAYLWVKTLHVVFMVTWFAGLFYLPRLFVYHALATDLVGIERFKVMERRLYRGIMTPALVLTVVFGGALWLVFGVGRGPGSGWLHAKLTLVAILIAHHVWLGMLLRDFARDANRHSDRFYRWINEIPALPVLVGVVYLVLAKPF